MENNFEKAIKLAIKGGYSLGIADIFDYQIVLLDPEFWKALGKGLGWSENLKDKDWIGVALDFFELKLTGGDENSFWEELLKEKNEH